MKLNAIILLLLVINISYAQEISIFEQFNGRYDYTAIGNTLNPFENNLVGSFCEILPSSNAELNLDPDNTIIAAYLFWAGSGLGDETVTLNNQDFIADNTFNVIYSDTFWGDLSYFSSVTDITDFVLSEGNTTYNFSNLDISETLTNNPGYCANRTNFAGWSIYVIYENNSLPLNQVNLFVGLDIINRNVQEKEIILDNINVLDNEGAKIGFLAWEGDNALNYGESLSINGNILSNPPLNNPDNAFNGTNSFTNSSTLYNCDLDVYSIESNISIGDTQATIKLTTGDIVGGILRADLIILNNIITVLNSQLPDGTITINNYEKFCNSNTIIVSYNVNNFNCTDPLPANTPIAFYADNILVGQSQTNVELQIDETINYTSTINIPSTLPLNFELSIVIDDIGNGSGITNEISEINNASAINVELFPKPVTINLEPQEVCNIGFNSAYFDLSETITNDIEIAYFSFSYFESLEDLNLNINEITDYNNHLVSDQINKTIYIRAEKPDCFDILQLELNIINCPPDISGTIGISPNNDGLNDTLNIPGLYNVYFNHELLIYNRYGTLVFSGNNNTRWNGTSNRGINKNKILPVGTYFYVIKLNQDNLQPVTGYIYLNK